MDWLHHLSVGWLGLIVLAAAYALTAAIYVGVLALAKGERERSFASVSPGMLPPMGLLFGLLVGFLAAQVWSDANQAQLAVNREASALRSVVLLADAFPGEPRARMRLLVRRHIHDAVTQEWPAMAHDRANLTLVPTPLADALHLAISLDPRTEGQKTAQREVVSSIQDALDARRQRIIVSQSSVNWVKWTSVILVGVLTLLTIAFVHIGNRLATALALWVFATALAASIVLITAQDRPFSGQFGVKPTLLVQVTPR